MAGDCLRMKLKCIGGPCHNQIINDCSDKLGDHVQVREPRKFDITAPMVLDPYKASEMMTDIIHYYIVDSITYKNENMGSDQIKFLRYLELATWDTIRIALN